MVENKLWNSSCLISRRLRYIVTLFVEMVPHEIIFFLFQRQLSAKRVKNVLARSSQTQNYASQPLIYYSFLSLLEDITRIQACKYHHYIWLDAIVLKARHHIHLLMFLGQSFCKSLFLDLEIYKKGNFINHQVHLLQNKKKY